MSSRPSARRLILAAALALTPSAPRIALPREQARASVSRHAGFRLFRRRSISTSQPVQAPIAQQPREPIPYGHIPLPLRQSFPTSCLPCRLYGSIACYVSTTLNERAHDGFTNPYTS